MARTTIQSSPSGSCNTNTREPARARARGLQSNLARARPVRWVCYPLAVSKMEVRLERDACD